MLREVLLLALCVAVVHATVAEQRETQDGDDEPAEIDGYDDRGNFEHMSIKQLKAAAQKQAAAFGICTLTAKRLKHSFCKTASHERAHEPSEKDDDTSSEDSDNDSPIDLGEGAEVESGVDAAMAEMERVSERILNGPSVGATMLDKMGRGELLEFNKKSITANSLCQRSLLNMRVHCKHKTSTAAEHEKVKDYGNGGSNTVSADTTL